MFVDIVCTILVVFVCVPSQDALFPPIDHPSPKVQSVFVSKFPLVTTLLPRILTLCTIPWELTRVAGEFLVNVKSAFVTSFTEILFITDWVPASLAWTPTVLPPVTVDVRLYVKVPEEIISACPPLPKKLE